MLEAAREYLVLVVLRKIDRQKIMTLVSGVFKQCQELLLVQQMRALGIEIILGGLVMGAIQNNENTVLPNDPGYAPPKRLDQHENAERHPAGYVAVAQAERNKPGLVQNFHMAEVV